MNDPEIIKEFLVESYENLDQLDRDLVVLEKDPTDREKLARIFRTFHTIKGNCGFLGFAKLEAATHVGENLLSRLRDGLLVWNAEITSALLALADAVREMLAQIEKTAQDGEREYTTLIDQLTRLADGEKGRFPFCPPATPGSREPACSRLGPPAALDPSLADASKQPPSAGKAGDPLVNRNFVEQEELVQGPNPQPSGAESFANLDTASMEDGLEAAPIQAESRASDVSDHTIRVDVRLLDKLMTLVGELVLARNQLLQLTATQNDSTLVSACQHLNLITTELQEGVMKTRMQPIATVWKKFPRVARDLALACRKQVQIDLEGKETELDKAIIEAIKDPLTHLVRNAVDHGIEMPELRRTRGKPAEGRLSLRAFHEGGQVNIEIGDDGGGIDLAQIKQKALDRALITREQAALMSDRELLQLIFLPGFSTADKITNVSGRGVGMDVVKTNVEKIGGTIDIHSQPGQGTTVKIRIPLTLAIIPALIVTTGGDRYAIPQFSLLELVRLEGAPACRNIEKIHTTPVFRLRGNLIPLVYLDREFKIHGGEKPAREKEAIHIVVLQADDRPFGLVVDAVNDTEEIVVKPLSKQLKRIPLFAGATIMGDGRVALILDVPGLAQCAGVISQVRKKAENGSVPQSSKGPSPFQLEKEARSPNGGHARQTLLLLGLGPEHRLAIPLHLVTRLEEIPLSAVEKTALGEVVQYRGQILPLLRLADLLEQKGPVPLRAVPNIAAAPDRLQVVVHSDQGRSIGLVVDRILDTVETALEVRDAGKRPGILGSAVIGQRVTDLLDLPGILQTAGVADCPWEEREPVAPCGGLR